MLRSFKDRYLPVFQAPDAPGASSSAPSGGSEPSTSGATPSSAPSSSSSPAPTTPSATPSAEPQATPDAGDGADSSFEFMFSPEGGDPTNILGDLGLSPPEPKPQEPKPTQPPSAEPPKPAATAPEPAAPAPTATPAPTEATSPTAATQPNLDPFDPGQLAQHLEQNQEQVVQYVADNLFKLSDKDVEALESDVVGTIPKLLARSFVAAQQNLLMQMSRIIPNMIQRHGEVTKQHNEAVNEFYTRWPDIGKAKDQRVAIGDKQVAVADLVKQYATVYRQMHPQASRQDAIEAVGPMVMMAAKLVPSAAAPQSPAQRPSPMAPTGASGRPPQPSPFTPAGPSAGGAAPTTVPQLSPVEAMFAGEEQ